MRTATPYNASGTYRPAWQTVATACEIIAVIHPGGFFDRFFGGHSPVYIVRVAGDEFATSADTVAIDPKGI